MIDFIFFSHSDANTAPLPKMKARFLTGFLKLERKFVTLMTLVKRNHRELESIKTNISQQKILIKRLGHTNKWMTSAMLKITFISLIRKILGISSKLYCLHVLQGFFMRIFNLKEFKIPQLIIVLALILEKNCSVNFIL